MIDISHFLDELKQHEKLSILIRHPGMEVLTGAIREQFKAPHRKTHYFFMFLLEGSCTHAVDLRKISLAPQQLLFVLPDQIHQLPPYGDAEKVKRYFKLSFGQDCLSMLPRNFAFLMNPLQQPKISFDEAASNRLTSIFQMLAEHLVVKDTPAPLIIAHLHTLLTEINHAYFLQSPEAAATDDRFQQYLNFKLLIEQNFPAQPMVSAIASQLGMSTTALYNVVTHYAGVSPKTFVNNRLILEAQRKLYYSEGSVKEIAFELGFNDPDYFSRLFRKVTGKTVSAFAGELRNLSGS